MSIGILAIATAVLLSIISAVFSVSGIMTIFAGAALSVGIMGGVLELSKITATVWLHQFWKTANRLMKTYFMLAVVILIFISSLGIYGYLAMAYVGQSTESNQLNSQISRIEQRIERSQTEIERSEKQLELLDDAIDQYIELNAITRGLDRRDEQAEEREAINQRITNAEDDISEYQDEILEIQQRQNEIEVNVGPIKYIAALLPGEEEGNYDRSARILMILFVIVFDPFAVLLMVAGQVSIENRRPKTKVSAKKSEPNKKKTTPAKRKSTTKPKQKSKPKQKPVPTVDDTQKKNDEKTGTEEPKVKDAQEPDPTYDNEEIPRLHRKTRRVKKR